MFSGCAVLLDGKKTKLGSRNYVTSPSAGNNTRDLVSCHAWKRVLTAISGCVWIFLRSLGVICYDMCFQ